MNNSSRHNRTNVAKNRDSLLVDLGWQLVAERRRRGMSQAALAEAIGGKTCTIGRLERGEGVKTDTLARVLSYLRLTIELTPLMYATGCDKHSDGVSPNTRALMMGHLTASIKLVTSDMPPDITAAICKHVDAIDSLIEQLR